MENIMIYPYNKQYKPYVVYQELMTGFMITELVSPKGWGITGDKIKTKQSELIVTDSFEKALRSCSVVWFVKDDHITLPTNILEEKINQAILHGKKIIYTRYSDNETYLRVKTIIPPNQLITLNTNQFNETNYEKIRQKRRWYDNNIPVLFVLGVSENTDKFEVQVSLRSNLIKKGYKVASVTSRRDSDILNMHPIPDFMFSTSDDEVEKILKYRWFIKQLELEEEPDLIIIGIPGGAIPYDRNRHNNFGIMAFEISNAVDCDYAILCSSAAHYDDDYFENISCGINEKLNVPIKYHHIAACFIGPEETHLPGEYNFISLSISTVKKFISTFNEKNAHYLLDSNEIDKLADGIICELSQNQIASV